MVRSPCCAKVGLNQGAWTAKEDMILCEYIKAHGDGGWRSLPKKAGLNRCGKSCRLRWLNYLRPDIKRGNISPDEEELIVRLHRLLGNRWSLIAGRLPGRTDNEIKNYWNTHLSKKLHCTRKNQLIDERQAQNVGRKQSLSRFSGKDDTIKPGPVRTKAVKGSKVALPGDSAMNNCARNGIPNHAFDTKTEHSTINTCLINGISSHAFDTKTTDASESLCQLLLDDSEPSNVRIQADSRHSPSSFSSLMYLQFPHSDIFEGNPPNASQSLLNLNELPSPQCNLFSGTSSFRLEEMYSGPGLNDLEPKYCVDNDIPHAHSFSVADAEAYNSTHQIDWINELEYM